MNYEQKYKDALERAKKLQETCDSTAVVGWCEYLFPELKESEDERIKKAIISHLQHEYVVKRYIGDVEYDKWIAWLEKQKLNTSKREIDDAYLQGICDAKHEIEKQGEHKTLNADEVIAWLENNLPNTYGFSVANKFKQDFGL